MPEVEQTFDPGLRAANLALAGQRRRDATRVASIDLRFADGRSGAWEVAAMAAIGFGTFLVVIALWFV